MILHPSDLDYDEFSRKYDIPKSCLPNEYGGELGSIEELHAKFVKEFVKKADYFFAEEQHRECDTDD